MGYALFVFMLAGALAALTFNSAAAEGAAEGLRLFACSALPSLFPFMVFGQFFIAYKEERQRGSMPRAKACRSPERARSKAGQIIARITRALFECLLCAVCGIPSSAMICAEKTAAGTPSARASALCAAMNQASPMFIACFAASGLLKRPGLWPVLAVSHYLPALSASLLLNDENVSAAPQPSAASSGRRPAQLLGKAISNTCAAALRICGAIVFFRVLTAVAGETGLFDLIGRAPAAVVSGMAEMTNGLSLIAELGLDSRLCASLMCFVLSFGGICVYMQSLMFFEELRPLPYFSVKLIIGSVSFLLCMMLYPPAPESAAVFGLMGESLPAVEGGAYERGVMLLYAFLSFALAGAFSFLYSRIFVRRRAI